MTDQSEQTSFRTKRMTLRPLRQSDVGLLTLYAGMEDVARMTATIPHPLPPGASEAFVSQCLSGERVEDAWAMDGSDAGMPELVGVISLERMDRNQSEIGYWVAPAFWNAGLASEALDALLTEDPHKARSIFAAVFQDNPASSRVLVNAGFAYLGEAETFCVARCQSVPTNTYIRQQA